jgi:hypothetical protein
MDYTVLSFKYNGYFVNVEYCYQPALCKNKYLAASDWDTQDWLDINYLEVLDERGQLVDIEVSDEMIMREIDRRLEVDL